MVLPQNSKLKLGRGFHHAHHISWPHQWAHLQTYAIATTASSVRSLAFLSPRRIYWISGPRRLYSSQETSHNRFLGIFSVCDQHRNRPLLGRPRSKRTPPMPVTMISVKAQLLTKACRASGAVCRRSELVEPCAATCVVRGTVRRCFEKLGTYQVQLYNHSY